MISRPLLAIIALSLSLVACKNEQAETDQSSEPVQSSEPQQSGEPDQSGKPDQEVVSQEITAMSAAIYSPDLELLHKHTHQNVIDLMGGKKAYLKGMQQVHETITNGGVSFVSAEIGEIDYFTAKDNDYLLASSKITLKKAGKDITTPGHQLGVRPKGEQIWKYIDCSALNDKLMSEWFPDFPKDRKIP